MTEINSLKLFVESKYHIRNKSVIPLLNVLLEFHPTFASPLLSKEYISKRIYPQKKYKDSTIRDLLGTLFKNVEDFFLIDNLKRDPVKNKLQLITLYRKRRQIELFNKTKKDLEIEFVKNIRTDYNYLFNRIAFDTEIINFEIENNTVIDKAQIINRITRINRSTSDLILAQYIEMVDRSLKIQLYRNKFNLSLKENASEKYVNKLTDYILAVSESENYDRDFMFKIYYALFKSFNNFNEISYFENYRNLVKNYKYQLGKDDIEFHFKSMMTYCIKKDLSVQPSQKIIDIQYEIYDEYLNAKYFKTNSTQYLDLQIYRTVLIFGLKYKKYDWVNTIIEDYTNDIQPEHREKMYHYGKAQLYCELGFTLKALNHLNEIDLDYFVFRFDYYNLKIRIFYENNYHEETLSLIHTYRAFLRNNDMKNEQWMESTKRYLYIVEHLILYKYGNSKFDLTDIAQELDKTTHIVMRSWLCNKIEEIKSFGLLSRQND